MEQAWYRCPYCGKKLLLLRDETRVVSLPVKCKGCHREFDVTVQMPAQLCAADKK